MGYIPNNSNSAYEPPLAGHSHDPAFSGVLSCQKMTYKDFLPNDTTQLRSKQTKTGARGWFNGLFTAPTYKDFLPDDTTQIRSSQRKNAGESWFNGMFTSPTYKDFLPRNPSSNKKKMGVVAWIGSILGGTIAIGLLGFFGRACAKGSVKNTWHELLGIFGKKPPGKKIRSQGGGSSASHSPTRSAGGNPIYNKATLQRNLNAIPVGLLNASQCKNLLFVDSKNFEQKNSQLCYLLSGLGSMIHHPEFENYLQRITMTRTSDGFTVKFPGQNETFKVSDDEIINHGGVASNSPGVHLWALAYRQCHGAIHDPNVQDDSVDALRRIFGNKDKSALVMGSQESEHKWWDTVENKWVDDERKINEFDATGISHQLESRPTPIREFLEGEEFEGKNRVQVLNHYLQWIKHQSPSHMALITAHKGGETGKYGHYYAIIPQLCDENHVCVMNTYSMGVPEQISIENFFQEGYKFYAHIDASLYPGNPWTDVPLGELWNRISSRPQETLEKRIQDIALLESKNDQPEIQNKLTKLREAILNTEHGSLRDFCLDSNNVPVDIINRLNNLYASKGIPSPLA